MNGSIRSLVTPWLVWMLWVMTSVSAFAGAELIVGQLALPAKLTAGQTVLAALSIRNRGDSAGLVTWASLDFGTNAVEAVAQLPKALPVAARGSAVVTFRLSVAPTIPQRHLAVAAIVRGRDLSNPQETQERRENVAQVQLQKPADLVTVGLESSRLTVGRGQPFNLAVRVVNQGEADAVVTGMMPLFDSPDARAQMFHGHVRIPGAGGQARFEQSASVGGMASVVRLTGAGLTAFDANSQQPAQVRSAPPKPVQLIVRPLPMLEILTIRPAAPVIKPGADLSVAVTLRNVSGGIIDFQQAALLAAGNLSAAPTVPTTFSLAGMGSTTTISLTLRANATAGSIRLVGAAFAAADRETGQPATVVANRTPTLPEVRIEK